MKFAFSIFFILLLLDFSINYKIHISANIILYVLLFHLALMPSEYSPGPGLES